MKGNELAKKPKYIETELGREKLCIHCNEYWPLDDEFFFSGKRKLVNGTYAKQYEATCKCCYKLRYKPHLIKGVNRIKSNYEKVA